MSGLFRHAVVLGGNGVLGRYWSQALARLAGDDARVQALRRSECNLLDRRAVDGALRSTVDLVINCAAYTDIDGAEHEEHVATAVNGEGVGLLADRCAELGALLVHFSSDDVFDGMTSVPYQTDDALNPINAYGRSKALGEERLRSSAADWLLVRTSWLYGAFARNFVKDLVDACLTHPSIRVPDDLFGRPTAARTVVDATLALMARGERGIFHVCDDGMCSRHDIASAIAAMVCPGCTVEACSTGEFPGRAVRPVSLALCLDATSKLLGPAPHWRASLRGVVEEIVGDTTDGMAA